MWTVKERVHLPFIKSGKEAEGEFPHGLSKFPGDRITKQEMKDARQTDEDIASLIKSGAIEEE